LRIGQTGLGRIRIGQVFGGAVQWRCYRAGDGGGIVDADQDERFDPPSGDQAVDDSRPVLCSRREDRETVIEIQDRVAAIGMLCVAGGGGRYTRISRVLRKTRLSSERTTIRELSRTDEDPADQTGDVAEKTAGARRIASDPARLLVSGTPIVSRVASGPRWVITR